MWPARPPWRLVVLGGWLVFDNVAATVVRHLQQPATAASTLATTTPEQVRHTHRIMTYGQDQLACASLLLPGEFFVAEGKIGGWPGRAVDWESFDGAQLATCRQGIFPWSPAMYCFVDTKLLFKMEVVRSLAELPGFYMQRKGADISGYEMMVLRDCNHEIMYVILANLDSLGVYEVYDPDGKLVARTRKEATFIADRTFKESTLFVDELGFPLALGKPADSIRWLVKKEEDMARFEPLLIQFYDAYGSRSSILWAQNRWLFAAIMQDREMRASGWFVPGTGMSSRLVIPSTFFLLLAAVLYAVWMVLFHMFFPVQQKPKTGVLHVVEVPEPAIWPVKPPLAAAPVAEGEEYNSGCFRN